MNDLLEVVATDGHRMGWCSCKIDNAYINDESSKQVLIPRKTVLQIIKQLKDDVSQIANITFNKHKISFIMDNGNTIISSKLVDGNFPHYSGLLAIKYEKYFIISTKKLLDAVDRSLILLDEKNSRSISLNLDKQFIKINAQSDSAGSITEEIELKLLDINDKTNSQINNKVQIIVNAYYLYEILRLIKTDNILFMINNGKQPIGIKEFYENQSSDNYRDKLYIIMPMAF